MKEHVLSICALSALFIIVAAVVILAILDVKINDMAALGFAGAITALCSGFTPSYGRGPSQATTLNLPKANNATITNTNDQASSAEPGDSQK